MVAGRRRRRRGGRPSAEVMQQWTAAQRAAYERELRLDTPVAEMGVSVRLVNTLESLGIILCRDLLKLSADQLYDIPNFGDKMLVECREGVKRLGLPAPWGWRLPRRPHVKKVQKPDLKPRKRR